jgi:hypothetical protein
MPRQDKPTGSELFIVDNSDADWKVQRYLADWCQIAKSMDIATEQIADDPARIVEIVRCDPETPRRHEISGKTLVEIRAKVEKHVKNTYLKQVQAPIGVTPLLKCWMELS